MLDTATFEQGLLAADDWRYLSHLSSFQTNGMGARGQELKRMRTATKADLDAWLRYRYPHIDECDARTLSNKSGELVPPWSQQADKITWIAQRPEPNLVTYPELAILFSWANIVVYYNRKLDSDDRADRDAVRDALDDEGTPEMSRADLMPIALIHRTMEAGITDPAFHGDVPPIYCLDRGFECTQHDYASFHFGLKGWQHLKGLTFIPSTDRVRSTMIGDIIALDGTYYLIGNLDTFPQVTIK